MSIVTEFCKCRENGIDRLRNGQLPRRRRPRADAPMSKTAIHDSHEKINSLVSFSFLYGYGAQLGHGGPWGRRSLAKNNRKSSDRDFDYWPLDCIYFNFIQQ